MAALTALLKEVTSRVPNVSESWVQDQLRYVIQDFCKETLVWRMRLPNLNVVQNTAEVAVNPIAGVDTYEAVWVIDVFLQGNRLAQLTRLNPQTHDDGGTPRGWLALEPTVVTLSPVPDANFTGELDLLVALRPLDNGVDPFAFPDFIERNYFEAILDGTLAKFYQQPEKPYTNAKAAEYHLRRYRHLKNEARSTAERANTPYGQNWVFPRFGV